MLKKLKQLLVYCICLVMLVELVPATCIDALAATLRPEETDENLLLSNEYVTLTVNKTTGGYTLKNLAGDILTKTDDNKQLLYRGTNQDSSFATLRIDGKNYIYGNTKNGGKFVQKPYIEDDKIISSWTQEDVLVTQTITLLTDSKDDLLGNVKISYTVKNVAEADKNVGARMVLDTMLGAQDYAYYEMPDAVENGTYKEYSSVTSIEKGAIAAHWRAIDNNAAPRVVAYGYIDENNAKPDKIIFGHWYDMASNAWDFEINKTQSLIENTNPNYKTADSAVAIYWEEDNLPAGATKTFSHYYGIMSNSDVGKSDNVKMTVRSNINSLVLNEENNGYVEDTINLQVTISNTLPNSQYQSVLAVRLIADNSYLKVLSANSDAGESLEEGKDLIRITNFEVGQTKIINWSIKVTGVPAVVRYLPYMLKVYEVGRTSTGEADYLETNVIAREENAVLAPGSSGEQPKVTLLSGLPNQMYYKGNRSFIVRGKGMEILASDRTQWQLRLTEESTGKVSFIDSADIRFNADNTCMSVQFVEEMPEGAYSLTILPGENLTDEQVGLEASITAPCMKFYMSSDTDLINPPLGAVAIKKVEGRNGPAYEIETFDTEAALEKQDGYMLTMTGNLYQTKSDVLDDTFIPITGNGSGTPVIIDRILSFKGSEFSIDYTYENGKKTGVQIKMDGPLSVIGGSGNMSEDECKIVLEDGTDYSKDPDEVAENKFVEPISITMEGFAGALQKLAGFVVDLKYGNFYEREQDGTICNTISFGGNLSLGFMSIDEYDGVDGNNFLTADIEDVRFGERKNKNTGFIGIKSKLEVGVPQFLSFLPTDMSGSLGIDTIDHNYLVNVAGEAKFATFKSAFEIEIVGSPKHGVPVPNILSVKVGGVSPGAPIVLPVVPIVYLHGGSGKVENLYSLFFPGETGGWPSTTLGISGQMSIEDVFKGWLGIELGTRSASLYAEDIKALEMDFLQEARGSFTWYPELSFELSGNIEVLKIIKGSARAYLLLYGDGAPDVDISADVSVVLPSFLLGKDLELIGVSLGGNKTKLYGSTCFMGTRVAFEYLWGSKKSHFSTSTFKLVGSDNLAEGEAAFQNVRCVAVSEGDMKAEDSTAAKMSYRSASEPAAKVAVDENGSLIINNPGNSDVFITAYYDQKSKEKLETSNTTVKIDGVNYSLSQLKSDENGAAVNADTANFMISEDELGSYAMISIPAEKIQGASKVEISSDKATFAYGRLLDVEAFPELTDAAVSMNSDDTLKVEPTITNKDMENMEGSIRVYLGEEEGQRTYGILTADAKNQSYPLNTPELENIEIPDYVPSGKYYVTVVIDGTANGVDFNTEFTTSSKFVIKNPKASESLSDITVTSAGNNKIDIVAKGFDVKSMDGIYVSLDRVEEDGNITKGYQTEVVPKQLIDENGKCTITTLPEEVKDYTYQISARSYKNLDVTSEQEAYALSEQVGPKELVVPYPNAAKVKIAYSEDYKEEDKVLGSNEQGEEEVITYKNKVFTDVDENGLIIQITADQEVTGTVTLNDQVIATRIELGTQFPSYCIPTEDGDYTISVKTKNAAGDENVIEENFSIKMAAPDVQILSPQDGTFITNTMDFKGIVEGETVSLKINGEEVVIPENSQNGNVLDTTITIPESVVDSLIYNIEVIATDAYQHVTTKQIQVFNGTISEIKEVFMKYNTAPVLDGSTKKVAVDETGDLTLYGRAGDKTFEIPAEQVTYTSVSENEDKIQVSEEGKVTVHGEDKIAVQADYYVTDKFSYHTMITLDSYQTELADADAKAPKITKNLDTTIKNLNLDEEVTLSVEAESEDQGTLSYQWYETIGDVTTAIEGATEATYKVTCKERDILHKYCVVVTNTIRTSGVATATVTSDIAQTYGKLLITEDHIKIDGDKVTVNEIDWYHNRVTVQPALDTFKIAFVNPEGVYEWKDSLELNVEPGEQGSSLYNIILSKNEGTMLSEQLQITLHKDKVAPSGVITAGTNQWKAFLNKITFGYFFKESMEVTVDASDSGSGVANLYTYVSKTPLTLEEVKALDEKAWNLATTTDSVKIGIENGKSVVYAKLVDNVQNVEYYSSDGLCVGERAPVATITTNPETAWQGENVFRDQVEATVHVEKDEISNAITEVSYQVDDESWEVVEIKDPNQVEFKVVLDTKGTHEVKVHTKNDRGNEATESHIYKIYQPAKVTIDDEIEVVYDGDSIEEGIDFTVDRGTYGGEITYSYTTEETTNVKDGLPANPGTYVVTALLAQDDTTYAYETTLQMKVTIIKGMQHLAIVKSDYIIEKKGQEIKIDILGVKNTEDLTVESLDTSILTVDNSTIVYDEETQIVTLVGTIKKSGNCQLLIKAGENDRYDHAELTCDMKFAYKENEAHPYSLVGGVQNKNGWYITDLSIKAMEGYRICETENGIFQEAILVNKEGNNVGPKKLYFMDAEGIITSKTIEEQIMIDKSAPTGTITIKESILKKILNKVTFGYIGNASVDVMLEGNDEVSGMDEIAYYKSEKTLTTEELFALSQDAWTKADKFSVEPDAKFIVYARFTDVAGNVSYSSSDKVLLDATPAQIIVEPNFESYKWITDAKAEIKVTVSDELSDVQEVTYQIDAQSSLKGDKEFTINTLKDGVHTIVITAKDMAGNVSTKSIGYKKDTTFPALVISGNTQIHTGQKTKLSIQPTVGISQIASLVVAKDGNQIADITKTFTKGYEISEVGTYEFTITNGAGISTSKTVKITGSKQGWVEKNGYWYYINANGTKTYRWLKIDGIWYYFGTDGKMKTKWQKVDGSWYYLGKNGKMTTGWQKIDNIWYRLATNGKMVTGWYLEGKTWYYLKSNGAMLTEWNKISGKYYYFGINGKMATGWRKLSGKWYYLASDGKMVTGWQKSKGAWYYLKESGEMSTGWIKLGNTWYYMDSNGGMQIGWLKQQNKWYYFVKSGAMQANKTMKIKGKVYCFNSNGICMNP